MRRGEIWTVADRGDYTGKPRPVVILQDQRFSGTDSITVCPLTSTATEASWLRIPVEAGERSGLNRMSFIMVDKLVSVRRSRVGSYVGRLSHEEWNDLTNGVIAFLGLTDPLRD